MKRLAEDPWIQIFVLLALLSGAMTAHSGLLRVGRASGPRSLWRSLSGRTLEPRVPGKWVVDLAGGAGADTTDLAEAAANARPGSEILIRPGVHPVQLGLNRPLTLIGQGAGPEEVTLLARSSAAVDAVSGSIILRNLALVFEGTGGAALRVAGGDVRLTRVRLRAPEGSRGADVLGGRLAAEDAVFDGKGTGVMLLGRQARGEFVGALFYNSGHGLRVSDGAQALVSSCVFKDNAGAFAADAEGLVQDSFSTIRGSRETAVLATDRAKVRLSGTRIEGSRRHGITLAGGAEAVLNRVRITDGGGAGVSVTGKGELHGIHLEIRDNRSCAIELDNASAFLDSSVAGGNQCGVAFFGKGSFQSNGGDFTGNARGALLYSDRFKAGIFLRGTGNVPPDFQALFR